MVTLAPSPLSLPILTLTIDIGNSDVVFGIHSNNVWRHIWRTPSHPAQPISFYRTILQVWLQEAKIPIDQVQNPTISSVVPALTSTLCEAMEELLAKEPVVVGPPVYPKLPVKVLRPQEIGSDLVANAVASHMRYRQTCVVVDFGTALTFTTVKADGTIAGIAIAPGLRTAIKSLFANTAQLPEVPIEEPKSVLGQNTMQSIQAGIVIGYEGLVLGMIDHIRRELDTDCIVVATGGLSKAIPSLHPHFVDVIPSLTLDGIRLIGEYARS
ncbi:type III pantothenate kinase [Fibrella aestuarina BUZ 2]|uniref:Type III pantothenate kinase n=1 Tax=Fibrella aestuarina BUZ 2 TaxID=1166018 RepID=I0K2S4_9BACT|nr:type III pantothenate kinase [Fibrella aestuarina BUZ 2]